MIDTNEILSTSIDPDRYRKPGEKRIYFLIKGNEIVYVGQSKNPKLRFVEHRLNGKDFDLVSVFDVSDVKMINEIEADLIARFNPKLNIRMHANKWIRKCKNKDPDACFSRVVKKRKFCKERMESFYIDEVITHKYQTEARDYTLYDSQCDTYQARKDAPITRDVTRHNQAKEEYGGLSKATYYRRLKEWTLTLYDKDGNAYLVNPNMVMEKPNDNNTTK